MGKQAEIFLQVSFVHLILSLHTNHKPVHFQSVLLFGWLKYCDFLACLSL